MNDRDRDVRKDNPEVLRCEVEDVMRRMKNGKSEDEDGLVAELLKYGGEKVVDAAYEGVNEVWRSGVVPNSWKRSEFVAIPKPQQIKVGMRWTPNDSNNQFDVQNVNDDCQE